MSFGNPYGGRRPRGAAAILNGLVQLVSGFQQGQQQRRQWDRQEKAWKQADEDRTFQRNRLNRLDEQEVRRYEDEQRDRQARALEARAEADPDNATRLYAAAHALRTKQQLPPPVQATPMLGPAMAPALGIGHGVSALKQKLDQQRADTQFLGGGLGITPGRTPAEIALQNGLQKLREEARLKAEAEEAAFSRGQREGTQKHRDTLAQNYETARQRAYQEAYSKALASTGNPQLAAEQGRRAAAFVPQPSGLAGGGGMPASGGMPTSGSVLGEQLGAVGGGNPVTPSLASYFRPGGELTAPAGGGLSDVLGAFAQQSSPAGVRGPAIQPGSPFPPMGAEGARALERLRSLVQANPPRDRRGMLPGAGLGTGAMQFAPPEEDFGGTFRTPEQAQIAGADALRDLNQIRAQKERASLPYAGRQAQAQLRRANAEADRAEQYGAVQEAILAQRDRALDAQTRIAATNSGIQAARTRLDAARLELDRIKVRKELPAAVKMRAEGLQRQMELRYRAAIGARQSGNEEQAAEALSDLLKFTTEYDGLLGQADGGGSQSSAVERELRRYQAYVGGRKLTPKEREAIANQVRRNSGGR